MISAVEYARSGLSSLFKRSAISDEKRASGASLRIRRMYSSRFGTSKSRRSAQCHAPVTGTPKVRIAGKQYMAALFADEPVGPL